MSNRLTLEGVPAAVEQIQADLAEIKRNLIPTTPQPKESKPLLNVPETAAFLGLSEPTIYRHVSARTIPYHKQSSRLYFVPDELMAWVKSGRKNPRS